MRLFGDGGEGRLAVGARGRTDCASAVAGEFSSRWFRPSFYEGTALVDAKGRLPTEADFLRFTLSDGAGAVVVEPKPRPDRACCGSSSSISCRWPAASIPACGPGGTRRSRRAQDAWCHAGPRDAHAAGAIALLQDFALLKVIIRAWLGVYLEKVDQARIEPDRVDWLLCHYSARSLRAGNRRSPEKNQRA